MNNGLLKQNMIENHYRALRVIIAVTVLIGIATTIVYLSGLSSGALNGTVIAAWIIVVTLIIGGSYFLVRRNEEQPWSPYIMVVAMLLTVLSCRYVSPIIETVSMMYLVIIISLLYFDRNLTLISCLLCVVADILLLKAFPHLVPGESAALAIRYCTFIFASVAAYIGAVATQKLLGLAVEREEEAKQVSQQLKKEAALLTEKSEVLQESTQQIKKASETNRMAMAQVETSANEVAETAGAQAAETDTMAYTVNGMIQALSEIGKNVEGLNQNTQGFTEMVSEGRDSLANQVGELEKAGRVKEELGKSIQLLETQSSEIENIVASISGIAEQTGLLALNAAIEAARAGEQGRGFAVVAEEVRKLADESALAAQHISQIIADVQQNTHKTVLRIEESSSAFQQQVSTINSSQDLLGKVADQAQELYLITNEIAATIEELVASSDQISQSIQNISAGGEELAAAAQEVGAITHDQLAQIETINNQINQLDDLARELRAAAANF